jgi:hypothetical protein
MFGNDGSGVLDVLSAFSRVAIIAPRIGLCLSISSGGCSVWTKRKRRVLCACHNVPFRIFFLCRGNQAGGLAPLLFLPYPYLLPSSSNSLTSLSCSDFGDTWATSSELRHFLLLLLLRTKVCTCMNMICKYVCMCVCQYAYTCSA